MEPVVQCLVYVHLEKLTATMTRNGVTADTQNLRYCDLLDPHKS